MKAQHSVKIQKLAAMIAFSEGKSYNSLKGQSKRIRSPWRYREGPGFRGELIPRQADEEMVSWQTAGAHHCRPRAVCQPRLPQQRGLRVDTASAKPDGAAANFPVNPDVCLSRVKTQKCSLNQSGF